MQPADLQRYEQEFARLDGDRDGLVQGKDCFGFFMQWGLDKAVLKHIWCARARMCVHAVHVW